MDETRVAWQPEVDRNTGTRDRVVARHDWNGRDTLAVTIITATSQARAEDPLSLPPLAETIDPDALDGLFAPLVRAPREDTAERGSKQPARGHVRFRYAACDVTVWADGTVTVMSA
ncbi:HalOD1 output domain-containing protein [Haloferax namakaokahaiae]|uniref:HalOD1 output domain-containing protein n=1 Tax=Haloferax namakaokahaiae TaxID=1748331 RepID=A0ABD5ZC64_9EURY